MAIAFPLPLGSAELVVWLSTATSTAVFVQGGQALVTHTEQESRARGLREQEVATEPGDLSTGLSQVWAAPECPD